MHYLFPRFFVLFECDSCQYAPKLKPAINKKRFSIVWVLYFLKGQVTPFPPFLKKWKKENTTLFFPPLSLPAFVKVAVGEEIFNFLSFSLLLFFAGVGWGVTLVNRNKGAGGKDTFWTFSRRDVFFLPIFCTVHAAVFGFAKEERKEKMTCLEKKLFK